MSEDTVTTATIPQARLDEMGRLAKAFDASNPGDLMRGVRDDGAESFYLSRQLEQIRLGVIETDYPALKGMQMVPVDTSVDPGVETFTLPIMNQVGHVRVTRDMDGIIPSVELSVTSVSISFFGLMLSYRYTLQEVRAAMYARRPLIAQKAVAVRSQMERKLDDILFRGEATVTNCLGILNQTSATSYTTPATGAGGSQSWDNKGPDVILKDLNGAPSQMITSTDEVYIPNRWLLPTSRYELINGLRVGDGTSESVLSYYIRNNAHIKDVVTTFKSESAGSGSSKRGVVYSMNPEYLTAYISQPFEQMSPWQQGPTTITDCHMRTGGVVLMKPLSMLYVDNI